MQRLPFARRLSSLLLLVLVAAFAVSGCSSVKGIFKRDHKDANEGVPADQL